MNMYKPFIELLENEIVFVFVLNRDDITKRIQISALTLSFTESQTECFVTKLVTKIIT